MNSKFFRVNILFAAIALIYANHVQAKNVAFPFSPRLNLYAGTGSQTYGRGDALIPLLGSNNGIFYTDVDASRNNDNGDRDAGLGLGVRIAANDDFMWGAYAFADRSRSHLHDISNEWTTINPGIEFMTNRWDGRLNVYIPKGDKQKVSNSVFGDQLGIANSVSFSGHNQYGELYNVTQEIGPGADLDFGYTFTHLKHLRIHGGGYYFSPKDTKEIGGGEIGAEFPMNRYFTLEVADAYDHIQHNQAAITLRVTLGGVDKSCSTPTVQERLLDPTYRHLAMVGTDTAVPVQGKNIATGQTMLERSNIWFFSSSNGSSFDGTNGTANCTYEHPCSGLSLHTS